MSAEQKHMPLIDEFQELIDSKNETAIHEFLDDQNISDVAEMNNVI